MSHGFPQTTQAVAKTINFLSVSKTPLLKTTPTEFFEHGEVKLGAYREPSSLFSSDFGIGRYSTCYQKGNVQKLPMAPLISSGVLPARYTRTMVI